MIEQFLQVWFDQVNDYLQRHYREMVQQEPSAEKLQDFRFDCLWLLRSARMLDILVKDPEYPARQFGPEIAGKLLQLESSWQTLNNPMTEADAEAVLRRAFPNDPLLQKLMPDEKRVGSSP